MGESRYLRGRQGGRLVPVFAALLICAMSVLDASPSYAAEVGADSSTYLRFRENAAGDRIMAAYEYLDLDAEELFGKDVSFHTSGWLRTDLGEKTSEDSTRADLGYAYFKAGESASKWLVQLGRVMVNEGVASEQMDGLYGNVGFGEGIGGFAAYAGVPVETDEDTRKGDSLMGGRVFFVLSRYSLGLSYLVEKNDSAEFRKESGLDLWMAPGDKFTMQGTSTYNNASKGMMEHAYSVTAGPFGSVNVTGEFGSVDYEHYFTSTTLSVFTPSSIDPQESVSYFGAGASFPAESAFTAALNFKSFSYDKAGDASRMGLKLSYASEDYSAAFSYDRTDGDDDRLSYGQLRAYAMKRFGEMDVTLDLMSVSYDAAINSVDTAQTAVAAVGYNFSEKGRAAFDVEYGSNPYFDSDVRGMLKLNYKFGGGA